MQESVLLTNTKLQINDILSRRKHLQILYKSNVIIKLQSTEIGIHI